MEVPREKSSRDLFLEICSENYKHSDVKIVKELIFRTFCLNDVSRCNTSSVKEKVDFCMEVIYPLSLKLIDIGSYYEQSLVVLVCNSNISFKNVTESKLDPTKIKSILFIERSDTKLSICPHFTLLTADLPTFVSDLNKTLINPINVVFIPKTVPFYKDTALRVMVINSTFDLINSKAITDASTALFHAGLGGYFSLQDQGRGDVTGTVSKNVTGTVSKGSKKARIIPTLTLGYSNLDAHRYNDNQISILGHIKPFIREGGLSDECKSAYLAYTKQVMQTPVCEGAFVPSNLNDSQKVLRESMVDECYTIMGGNPLDEHKTWFLNESNANLVADRFAPHCDTQNSTVPGLDDVLVFTTHPPVEALSSKKSPSLKVDIDTRSSLKSRKSFSLHEYVISKGYRTTFPYTRVHCMKGIMDHYVKRMYELEELKKKNKLSCLIVWCLTETMNTHLDYRGFVFDRPNFPDFFREKATDPTKNGSIFRGLCLQLPPAFDKMGYYSLNLKGLELHHN